MKKIRLFFCCCALLFVSASFAESPSMHGHEMGTMLEPLSALQGETYDVAFYSMMIAHHQGALDMAKKIEATADKEVKKWANDIVKVQSAEIGTMHISVEKLGGIDPVFYDMMDADMRTMVENTKNDRDFVELMIPHHKFAIEMAKLSSARTANSEILKLSEAIIAGQTQEIEEFEAWLKK